jgi:hypothetical protein
MASIAKESLKRKRTQQGNESDSDDASSSKVVAKPYKQRVLVSSSRGISQRQRHLMSDILAILPHAKKGSSSFPPSSPSSPLSFPLPPVVASFEALAPAQLDNETIR